METLEEAKDYLRENFTTGVRCPACDRTVKLNPVPLSSGNTRGLVELYKLDREKPNGYFHVREIEKYKEGFGGGAFAKCQRWGLVVDAKNVDPSKKRSGMWAITEKGRKFVRGEITVPSKCYMYNAKTVKFSEDRINIKQALGKNFNYAEVIGVPSEPAKAVSWL